VTVFGAAADLLGWPKPSPYLTDPVDLKTLVHEGGETFVNSETVRELPGRRQPNPPTHPYPHPAAGLDSRWLRAEVW
jgi:hypothetical protein